MKVIITIIVFFLINLNQFSQSVYNFKFEINEFGFDTKTGALKIIPLNNGYFYSNNINLPALPYTVKRVLIPPNTVIKCFSILNLDSNKHLENVLMDRNPRIISSSGKTFNSEFYIDYNNLKYPEQNVIFDRISILQGFTYANFYMCPFIYNETKKELEFINNIELSVTVVNDKEAVGKAKSSLGDKLVLNGVVINPEEADEFYTCEDEVQLKSVSNHVDYLIVTSQQLADAFLPLKTWKTRKGVSAKIITVEEIYASYPGTSNQLKIKGCLYDYHHNKNTKWVVFGGDDTVVPVQLCYFTVGGNFKEYLPSDLYYASFDKAFDWDANNNNLIGEKADDIDMEPDIYLSRLPVRSLDDVTAIMDKTLNYEKAPQMSNYIENILLAGKELYTTWDNLSDLHHRSEYMYNNYIAPYWNSGIKYKFYDTGTDFTGGASYDLTTANLQTQINTNQYHFLFLGAHGFQTDWGLEGEKFYAEDALALNNTTSLLVSTVACNTNEFDNNQYQNDPCLSEAFIRNPNGGSILYWGSSRESYGNSESSVALGDSFEFIAEFYKELFSGYPMDAPYKFAAITSKVKNNLLKEHSPAARSWAYLNHTFNSIGDPELSIFTENPSEFTNASVSHTGNTVTVNTGGVSGCTIALASLDGGVSYYEKTDNVSSKVFFNVNSPYYVTITKHNYKPYLYPNDVYVQNLTFNNRDYIEGENIYVGNNVSTSFSTGDVTITNGSKLVLDFEDEIVIENGFECVLGAELEIY